MSHSRQAVLALALINDGAETPSEHTAALCSPLRGVVMSATGTVKSFNGAKGFGFIDCGFGQYVSVGYIGYL